MDRPDPSTPSDDRLVADARAGDARALETLLVRHEAKVLRVLGLMGVPVADREDVAQDVFLRVFRHLRGFRSGHSFEGWIYRITVNASHDYRGRMVRRRRDEVVWEDGLADTADERPGPGEDLAGRESWRRLEALLEHLSERERAVFVLVELESLSSREAASTLGITSITVRRHLGRARARLQKMLETGPPEKK